MGFIAELKDRTLLKVSGPDAEEFLNGLFTCDTIGLSHGQARFGALLMPQGKILFDFFVIKSDENFLIDVKKSLGGELAKRLMFYRLRKAVEIGADDSGLKIYACWGECSDSPKGLQITDPRLPEMGSRIYSDETFESREDDYHMHRLAIGMPEGGQEYEFGAAFPHEVLMDQFGGVDFKKGCYVGQEVVSRMQHRGTARKRILKVTASQDLPPAGTIITAQEKPIGEMGSAAGGKGLALIRLDRAKKALDQGHEILADQTTLSLEIPHWVDFNWPEQGV